MKKIVAWLFKGSRIIRVLQLIYKALIIADSVAQTGSTVAETVNIGSDKTQEALATTKSYLEVAIEYVAKILEWLGVTASQRESFERAVMAQFVKAPPEEIRAQLEAVVKEK